MHLKKIVEQNDTSQGRIFDLFIQFLIIVSLVSFALETCPDISRTTRRFISTLKIITVVIFTGEYILRLIVADRKWVYIFSFLGLIDLLAILPFYLASGIDLRSIKIFRFLRLFRGFKMLRYTKAITRFKIALAMIKEELLVFLIAAGFLLYVAAVGIYYFENPSQPEQFKSIFHCLWWAVITFTTVGYGDVYPITVGGKIFTSFMVLITLGIIAVPTGLIASALTRTLERDDTGNQE